VPEAEVDALFRDQMASDSKMLSSMKYFRQGRRVRRRQLRSQGTLPARDRLHHVHSAIRSASAASAAGPSAASSINTHGPDEGQPAITASSSMFFRGQVIGKYRVLSSPRQWRVRLRIPRLKTPGSTRRSPSRSA
jgi:hypothetical protein